MSRRYRLTPEVQRVIVGYATGGATPEVAAEAAGIPAHVFRDWLKRGRQPGARQPYRRLYDGVVRARGTARAVAEADVFKNRKLDWLKYGPCGDPANRTGWGTSSRRRPRRPGPDPFADFSATVRRLLDALAPFPEARAAAANVLTSKKK